MKTLVFAQQNYCFHATEAVEFHVSNVCEFTKIKSFFFSNLNSKN